MSGAAVHREGHAGLPATDGCLQRVQEGRAAATSGQAEEGNGDLLVHDVDVHYDVVWCVWRAIWCKLLIAYV